MTTAMTPRKRESNGGAGRPPVATGLPPRTIRTPWIVLGVLVMAGSALGFGLWASSLDERTPALVAARTIDAGSVVTAEDVREADVSGTGVAFVPADRASVVLGRVATSDIPEGALLHPEAFSDVLGIDEGNAVVGVALQPGAVPTPQLRVGDRVNVVAVGGTDPSAPKGVLATAQVFAVEILDDSTRTAVVSLEVPAGDSAPVAEAAGDDRLRLVLLPPSSPDGS